MVDFSNVENTELNINWGDITTWPISPAETITEMDHSRWLESMSQFEHVFYNESALSLANGFYDGECPRCRQQFRTRVTTLS